MTGPSPTITGGRLEGRVAIITGASWGIGAAVAEAFAREGASVVVSSYPDPGMEQRADDVVGSIIQTGGRALRTSADVTSRSDIDAMVALAQEEFGDVDVLVSNAAYSNRLPWHEIPAEQWDHTHAVNVRGAFLCAQACREGMLRKGRGSIISVTSVTVELGMPGLLDYVASKAALIGFTRALAREVGPEGIRVNAVMPGAIRTEQEVALGFDEEELRVLSAQRQCLPRRGFADDLTGAFVFLASDESSFMTGQVLNVDGGWIHY